MAEQSIIAQAMNLNRGARRAVLSALLLGAGLPCAGRAQTCIPDTTPDWMASIPTAQSSAQVWPTDCALVKQTPPDFSWPDLSTDSAYLVTVTYPDGHSRSNAAPGNWINWDEALPAGSYAWQVQATNSGATQVSRARRFTVEADAVPFVVPDWRTLYERAALKPHPRAAPDTATAELMIEQRRAALDLALSQAARRIGEPLQPEPAPGASIDAVTSQANDACQRTLAAALAWLVTWDEPYLADALRRALNLAAWDPHGASAYANADEASAQIAWTLALAYDWLFPRLDAAQRSALLGAILARGVDMYDDVVGGRARVAVHPYDSHGNYTLTLLAAITTLVAGDVSQAEGGLRDALPLAIHWTSPWGREDGGFGNGSAYATWMTGNLLVAWYVLRWTVGVDLAQKAWVRHYADFLAYFLPPGTPSGVFGDGAESKLTEAWARFGKGYTWFAPSPLGRWYAAQLSGEDPTRLEYLLAPPADPSPAPYPAGTPNAAYLPAIGWAAMHSNLADPGRTSVYFKSSVFGSYNHSHADQNSFVVTAGGQPLAIDSGYYDGYGTPHWWQWYKQTRAHNAITFDGGKGQAVYEQGGDLGSGAITHFEHHADYDIVTGDAAGSYGGALSEARRSLVYLRPDLLVVYDRLASATPRRWEWNIHATNAMSVISEQKIAIANGGQSLCVDMLAAPPARFAQTGAFTAAPLYSAPVQWHGAFASVDPLGTAEFVALLRVGCGAASASASKADGVWTVRVNDRTVTIAASGIGVQ